MDRDRGALLTPGSLGTSSNGRYFVDGDGRPAFFLGDTQWELFRSYSTDEARHILWDRRDKGFNVILVMLLGVGMDQLSDDSTSRHANLHGERPWHRGGPETPNEAYFRHIDPIIRLGAETGQTLVVGVYHQWNVDTIPLDKARAWASFVAARYRDVPGLIWSMYPRATPEFVPVCREIARGLNDGDGGSHLVSVHPDPAVSSSSFIHDEEWLAFNMIQTCIEYDRIHEAVSSDYARRPVKPVVMAEGGYEGLEFGKLQSAHHVRKQAWWTHLAGAHHVYGHTDSWMAPRRWTEWLASSGARSMRVYRDVATSLDEWWDLVPDQSLIGSGASSSYTLNVAARSGSGRWIVAYLAEPSSVTLLLRPLASSRARAEWVDPRSGARMPIGSLSTADPCVFSTPEGWEDALLVVRS